MMILSVVNISDCYMHMYIAHENTYLYVYTISILKVALSDSISYLPIYLYVHGLLCVLRLTSTVLHSNYDSVETSVECFQFQFGKQRAYFLSTVIVNSLYTES